MYVGVDVGGWKIAAGLVSYEGRLVNQRSIATRAERPFEEVVLDIIALIKEVSAGLAPGELKGIGVGIPGIADQQTGLVYECVNLNWHLVPLGRVLQEAFQLPVHVGNDASVAALAEYVVGSLRGTVNALLITLGTGVGGGFIINGRLYSGANGLASEIGHMVVGDNFYRCNCGKVGCLETFASALALINYAKRLVEQEENNGPFSALKAYVEKGEGEINAKLIFDLAKEGDWLALRVVNRMVTYLAIGISNLVYTLDPEVIAIGGGVSKAGDYLMALLEEKTEELRIFKAVPAARLVLAELGNEAGIVGAAMLCRFS